MMYKLFDRKAYCYSKLSKTILTLKSLKIALCNANKVEKLLKTEINFPGLLFNIAQCEYSIGFTSMSFKSLNSAIN